MIDNGLTNHITKHLSVFTQIDKVNQPQIKLGNGDLFQAKGRGSIQIRTKQGTQTISNVLYIPDLDQNLLSVAQMVKNAYGVCFEKIRLCYKRHMAKKLLSSNDRK